VKILKLCSIILLLLTITACSTKVEKVYIDKPFEVQIPIKCVVPDVNCSFKKGTYTEIIGSMLECISDLKKANKVCK